jgi:prepilin-type N-terminal cleavage/methylation domain-containing protein
MKKGFTLIELLIVVAVIGILSSIIISSLNSSRQKSKVAAIKGAIHELLTQGQIYLNEYSAYAAATTSPRTGCYASSTFLTDVFFFAEIPSLMVANIDENGAPIACAISSTGKSFSIIANLGGNKSICVDSDSRRLEAVSIDGTSGSCVEPLPNAPHVPVFINNGSNFTPSTINITVGTTVDFNFSGNNNQSRTIECLTGGPTFATSASSPLYSYQFNTPGTYQCYRQGSGGLRGTINVSS